MKEEDNVASTHPWLDFNDAEILVINDDDQDKPDRDEIRKQLLLRLPCLVSNLYPEGRHQGRHFQVGSLDGERGQSLKITLEGERAGCWNDFATDDHGDIFDLVAARHHFTLPRDFTELLQWCSDWLGHIPDVPTSYKGKPKAMDDLGLHTAMWRYLDADNQLLACVYRYDTPEGKQYRPWDVRHKKHKMPSPRPLFQQPAINTATHVLLVEGEKCAEALQKAGLCATTAMGGARAPVEKTDWSPLTGKHVTIWPDHDDAGREYAERAASAITKAGAASLQILNIPGDKPAKWDAADALTEHTDITRWLKQQTYRVLTTQTRKPAFPFLSIGDLLDNIKPVSWLIKDMLETNSLALMFGEPGCGKSFLAIDIACSVATGLPWHKQPVKRPGPVFYLAGEGHNGIARRFKAWQMAHHTQLDDKSIYISAHSASLLDEAEAARICESIESCVGDGSAPVLLVIDTLARNFGPGDENNTEDMSRFISHLDRHFRNLWGCCVLVVHHTGVATQNRARGNSALKGALDAEYAIKRVDDTITLTTHKMKDAPEPSPRSFDLETIQLPLTNEDGEPETSCILKSTESLPSDPCNIRLGKTQQACLDILKDLYRQHQDNLIQRDCSAGGARVKYNDWRDGCVGQGKPHKARNNFSRTRETLVNKGQICVEHGYVYLCDPLKATDEP